MHCGAGRAEGFGERVDIAWADERRAGRVLDGSCEHVVAWGNAFARDDLGSSAAAAASSAASPARRRPEVACSTGLVPGAGELRPSELISGWISNTDGCVLCSLVMPRDSHPARTP